MYPVYPGMAELLLRLTPLWVKRTKYLVMGVLVRCLVSVGSGPFLEFAGIDGGILVGS